MRVPILLVTAALALGAQPSRDEALKTMRKAAEFYAGRVATNGGYHFAYADDLSYGRSEHGEGPTQIENQREGTPLAGMAFLDAWEATGDRYFLDAAKAAAMALVSGQLCSGGWDYVVEFDAAKRRNYGYRADGPCDKTRKSPPTTLDDNVTQACLRLLMRVDRALGFEDAKIHEATLFGLDALARAQYPNGAWAQRFTEQPDASKFPVQKASYPESWSREWPRGSYYAYYTFNDNTLADCIDTMLEAARVYKEPRYLASARRGGDFILLAQMPEPQPAWAQQYDQNMHPAWARQFEPPSVTGGETQGILRLLMTMYRETGDSKYLDAIPPALGWLEKSVYEFKGKPVLARFYELKTNRPLYITKGTQVSVKGGASQRIDGYEISYTGESVISHYAVTVSASGLRALRREYESVRKSRVPRADKLYGLSPWTGDGKERVPSPDEVSRIIASLDERGAWTQEGVIGKADRIVSVQPARDMVLTINGRPIPVKEDDRIEVFQGTIPPRVRIIRTSTFAANLTKLAAWVSTSSARPERAPSSRKP